MLKQTVLITLTIWAAASLFIFQTAYAQINEFKLLPFIGAAGDAFGESVSISGDYVIVGAAGDDENGDRSGSAHVFKRTGASWTQQTILLASDGAAGDGFGGSVSISGDYAIVGAFLDDDKGTYFGSAYVFSRAGTTWTQEVKLLPPSGAAEFNFFGMSVSISGDYAVVGAQGDDENGSYAGSAYVFKRTGTSWAQETKLLPNDGTAGDAFGSSSISGDYVIVGAFRDDEKGSSFGSAYVFSRAGTTWTQEVKLLPPDGAAEFNFFGMSVSISGDYAVVGAQGDDENGSYAGSAYVFKRTGPFWTQEAKLFPSDWEEEDSFFGSSVSISGDYIVVGADGAVNNEDRTGSAYVFKRADQSWTQEAKLLASDGEGFDNFGVSVSISGDYAVVGAWFDDDNGEDSGSAYVYTGFTPPVGVEDEITGLPAEFALSQNYPNPFNPETVIEYVLPVRSDVKLIIYNLRGEEVALLFDGTKPAGNHRVSWDASSVASGVYLYRLWVGDFMQTRKMLLLK